jgi:DNA-binding NtrC family response regulator
VYDFCDRRQVTSYVPFTKRLPMVEEFTPEESEDRLYNAATHQDLGKKIQDGNFRQDLYFRLNVLNIRHQALRERGSDILLLAEHFLVRSTSPPKSLSAAAAKLLLEHSWPGNVRELENVIRSSSLAVRGAALASSADNSVDARCSSRSFSVC